MSEYEYISYPEYICEIQETFMYYDDYTRLLSRRNLALSMIPTEDQSFMPIGETLLLLSQYYNYYYKQCRDFFIKTIEYGRDRKDEPFDMYQYV